MEGEEGGGIRLSKRFNSDNDKSGGRGGGGGVEVDYKNKAGTAWSHSYLNQKPWHPLSYPNQRRKWIAEQTHAQRLHRSQEVSREYAQEQEFFRQTALVSKKEKDKMETMQAVSFMYVRPPGYNAESAKAAEIADEKKKQELDNPPAQNPTTSMPLESTPGTNQLVEEKKKPRPKDVFGRSLPTEEEFAILKNAPRLETGVPARVKPFGIEIRNVKCVRCGNFGHQSGDRECPLKDAIMPNEESRLKRDDPLTAIMAHTDPSEPLKWELKQKPGMSPPRGGFDPDDPNQQIVAEDIFDEYGGFLGDGMPELLTNFSPSRPKKKRRKGKNERTSPNRESCAPSEDDGSSLPKDSLERRSRKEMKKKRKKSEKLNYAESSSSEDLELERHSKRCKRKHRYSFKDSDCHKHERGKSSRHKHSDSCDESDSDMHHKINKSKDNRWCPSDNSDSDRHRADKKSRLKKSSGRQFDFSKSTSSHRTGRRHSRHHGHQS